MKYITSDDLERWADMPEAKGDLPFLIRKLFFNHPDIEIIEMPAGSSVWKPGFDGNISVKKDALGLKAGKYVIEMGTNKNPKKKFKEDSAALTKKLSNDKDNISSYNFIFITPRKVQNKESWIQEVKKENPDLSKLESIQIFDADTIEMLLENDLSPTIWFSEKIGKPSEQIESAEFFWENWRKSTKGLLEENIILSREKDLSVKFSDFIQDKISVLILKGISLSELILYFIAWVKKQPNSDELLSRIIICKSRKIWKELVVHKFSAKKYILIHLFDEIPENIACITDRFQVLLSLKSKCALLLQYEILDIPDINKEKIIESFSKIIGSKARARNILEKAGYRLDILQRLLANNPLPNPHWDVPNNALLLIKLALLKKIDISNKEDVILVEKFLNKTWKKINKEILPLSNLDESPIEIVGSVIKISSPYFVLSCFKDFIAKECIDKFLSLFQQESVQINPKYSLPTNERRLNIRGTNKQISQGLKSGMSESLALLRAMEEEKSLELSFSIRELINTTVFNIFGGQQNSDWKLWASLTTNISDIAEGAPEVFLRILEKVVSNTDIIRNIFIESSGDIFTTENLIFPILKALERLAWNKTYLAKVCDILFEMYSWGDSKINCISASIMRTFVNIFNPLDPQTNASFEEMQKILKGSLRRNKDKSVKFDFLQKASDVHTISLTDTPIYCNWAIGENKCVSRKDQFKMLDFLYTELFDLLEKDGKRWATVIHQVLSSWAEIVAKFIMYTNDVDFSAFADGDLLEIKVALNSCLQSILKKGKYKRSDHEEQVLSALKDVLENKIKFSKKHYEYLCLYFKNNALNYTGENGNKSQRISALQDIVEIEGVEGLVSFINDPHIVRNSIYQDVADMILNKEQIEEVIKQCLALETQKSNSIVGNLSRALYCKKGLPFLNSIDISNWSDEWKEHLIAGYNLSREMVDWTTQNGLLDIFLQRCNSWVEVKSQVDFDQFLHLLLERKLYNKALEFANINIKMKITPKDILDILKNLDVSSNADDTMLQDYVENLFQKLYEDMSSLDEDEIVSVEMRWFELLNSDCAGNETKIPRGIKKASYTNPNFFIGLISIVFTKDEDNKYDKDLRRRCFSILNKLVATSKTEKDSLDIIENIIRDTRKKFQNTDLATIADVKLGELLANTPPEPSDNIFPQKSIRDIIEEIKSDDFEIGFSIGVSNKGGFKFVSCSNAGEEERKTASRFYDFAEKLSLEYPRTSAMIKEIAENYKQNGRDLDKIVKDL